MTATTGTWKALRAALAVNKAGGSTIPIRPGKVKVIFDLGLKSESEKVKSVCVQMCLVISELATYIRLKSNRGKQSKGLVTKKNEVT